MVVFDFFRRGPVRAEVPVDRRREARVRAAVGARVLVVDDSASVRAALGRMLIQDGYFVMRAADGEAGLVMALADAPALIFLGVALPGLSGFSVLRALRRDRRTRATPVIMLSGNPQATERSYVRRFGADGLIGKPFGRGDVFQPIRSLVCAGRVPPRLGPAE